MVEIPPGDPKEHDEPVHDLLWHMRPVKFQQKEFSTCLVDAFCSAMHDFGCESEVVALRTNLEFSRLCAGNKNIWGDFANLVNNTLNRRDFSYSK